jgi:hypothetical protein
MGAKERPIKDISFAPKTGDSSSRGKPEMNEDQSRD